MKPQKKRRNPHEEQNPLSNQNGWFLVPVVSILKGELLPMPFFATTISILKTLVIALGAGLSAWGGINLLEGYGNDNPGAKSQGIKQIMAGGGVVLIGTQLIPLLSGLFG